MSIMTPPYSSWTHKLVRVFVRLLVGTRVTPNHLTTARLVSGLTSCATFAVGTPAWNAWGGALWLISALLDRADGELARLGSQTSAAGHHYDYVCDVAVNSLVFFTIGVGLRNGDFGWWAPVLGAVAAVSVAAASLLSERLERLEGYQCKAYAGAFGFDFDDLLYLFAPIAWLGWFQPTLVGAAICAPAIAIWSGVRVGLRV